ncbi:high mobility group box domain-containing protein, partial [Amylostereum chailletii]
MASNVPEGVALFEFQKMQLINSLAAVADQMRNCAAISDQFSALVAHIPFNPHGQSLPMIPPVIPTGRGKRKADLHDEDGTGKKKRVKKIKDPNAPKRPASSYILFQNDIRTQLRAKHPDVPYSELMARVSKLWNELPADKKEHYEHLQAQAKREYVQKKQQYDEQNGVISPSTPAAEAASEAESSSPAVPQNIPIVREAEEDSDAEEESKVASSGSEAETTTTMTRRTMTRKSLHPRLPRRSRRSRRRRRWYRRRRRPKSRRGRLPHLRQP